MLIGTFGGMIIQEIFHTHENEKIPINSEESFNSLAEQNSIFDFVFNQDELTYLDEKLGFSIKKPNSDWVFNTNLQEVTEQNREKFDANGFLGGLYVEKNGDKSILVTVFDIPDKENFSLENYVEVQIIQLEEAKLDFEIIIKEISPDKKTMKLGIETDFGNDAIYVEEILKFNNGIFYMLQFTGPSLELIDSVKREEIRTIMDSFTII